MHFIRKALRSVVIILPNSWESCQYFTCQACNTPMFGQHCFAHYFSIKDWDSISWWRSLSLIINLWCNACLVEDWGPLYWVVMAPAISWTFDLSSIAYLSTIIIINAFSALFWFSCRTTVSSFWNASCSEQNCQFSIKLILFGQNNDLDFLAFWVIFKTLSLLCSS